VHWIIYRGSFNLIHALEINKIIYIKNQLIL